MATTAQEIFDSFESSFQDKCEIPESLELLWLKKAVARYSIELDELSYQEDNEGILIFDDDLSQYTIDTLAHFIKQSYQEREVSKVNKRVSIVTHDVSIDGTGNAKSAARNELLYDEGKSLWMKNNQMPTAYD